MLSQTAEHALRALLYLAQQPEGRLVPANRIAGAIGAPANYLGKTLQGLAVAGLVRGTRGRVGGYMLQVPASAITVADVIAAFETGDRDDRCLLGDRACSSTKPCGAHQRWQMAQQKARFSVGRITIRDLLSGASLDQANPAPLQAAS
jgi:Rrf2 family protein